MARTNNLTNFLTDVAAAIKAKLGTETPIPASQFDTKIGEIETGGTYQAKSITIQSNGSQTITPDSGYDALSSVAITVQVPIPQLQSKSYTFTDNTTITLNPETGYDGFSSITLTINVPQEGGSGDVKLFETEQAMQADQNPTEGDLAVVYRSEVQPCTATAHFSKAMFPETVVLDSALEDYVELRFRPVDSSQEFECWGMIDQSMFEMSCYGEQGEYRVQYESQDGITYTRTTFRNPDGDVTGNELDFGVEIYYDYEEMWNDVIGEFIQVGGKYFEGLYEYCLGIANPTKRLLPSISKITTDFQTGSVVEYDFSGEQAYLDADKLLDIINQIATDNQLENLYYAVFIDTENNIHVIPMENSSSEPYRNLEYR